MQTVLVRFSDSGEFPQRLRHQPRLQADRGVADLAVELRFRGQRRDRVDRDHVDRRRGDQPVGDLQRLLAVVGLGDEQLIGVDADRPRVDRVDRVLGVDEGADAAAGLGLGDDVVDQRGLTGGLRAEDLDDPAARHAADPERQVERQRPGRDRVDLDRAFVAEAHQRALAELALDPGDGRLERGVFRFQLPSPRASFKLTFSPPSQIITSLPPASGQLDLGQRDVARTPRLEFRTVKRQSDAIERLFEPLRQVSAGRLATAAGRRDPAPLRSHPGDRHMGPEIALLGLVQACRGQSGHQLALELGRWPEKAPEGRTARPAARRGSGIGSSSFNSAAGTSALPHHLGDRLRPRPPRGGRGRRASRAATRAGPAAGPDRRAPPAPTPATPVADLVGQVERDEQALPSRFVPPGLCHRGQARSEMRAAQHRFANSL